MYHIKILIVLLFLGLLSCDTIFSKKKTTTQNNTTLKPIDFKSIDAYPLLPECKNLSSRIQQKQCFYKMLSKRIQESLNRTPILLESKEQGTILVKLQVSEQGKIKIVTIRISEKIKKQEFKLDSLIRTSIKEIPQIVPAIKSGIPVKTEFTLPIVIKNN